MALTIVLATRGRPLLLCETLRRTYPNIIRDDTRLVVAIDDDDAETVMADLPSDPHLVISQKPREDSIGEKWNRGYRDDPADLYMIMADYTPVITPGFDQRMLDAGARFRDGIGVVFGHMANYSFSSTYGVTHGLCDKLGWMFPPFFPFWFVDHWIDDIARLIDRISFADVQLTWPEKKNQTQEMRDLGFWATFFDAMRLMRRRQARHIIDSPDFREPEWRKEIMRRHYPLVEHRSQSINNLVRSWAPVENSIPGGERYERLKAQAVAMMRAEWPMLKKELLAA
jgi:hypothetical protein